MFCLFCMTGADARKDDGVYSAYFAGFPTDSNTTISGISITMEVDNSNNGSYVNRTTTGRSAVLDIVSLYERECTIYGVIFP